MQLKRENYGDSSRSIQNTSIIALLFSDYQIELDGMQDDNV